MFNLCLLRHTSEGFASILDFSTNGGTNTRTVVPEDVTMEISIAVDFVASTPDILLSFNSLNLCFIALMIFFFHFDSFK